MANNGDMKMRRELEEMLDNTNVQRLSDGCVKFDDFGVNTYHVFDDGTVLVTNSAGAVKRIVPSVRYGGIKLESKTITLINGLKIIYKIKLVIDRDREAWFVSTLAARVADGQINDRLAFEFKTMFANVEKKSTLRFEDYAGHTNGYIYDSMDVGTGKVKAVPVHVIIAELFIGRADSFKPLKRFLSARENNDKAIVVNHMNSFRADNDVANLEWVTSKMNSMHGNFMADMAGVEYYEGYKPTFKYVEFSNKTGNITGHYFVCSNRMSALDVYYSNVDIYIKNR